MDPTKILKQKGTDNGWQFKVVVGTPPDQTTHRVTLTNDYHHQVVGEKVSPDQPTTKP